MNTTTTRVMALRTFFAETTSITYVVMEDGFLVSSWAIQSDEEVAEVAREWDAHRAALV